MNNVNLIGRLTKDPVSNSAQIVRFTLAVNRRFKKEGQPDADFITVVALGKNAENAMKYLTKGRRVAVSGSWQSGSYEKDGVRIYTNECLADSIEYLDGNNTSDNTTDTHTTQNNGTSTSENRTYAPTSPVNDPFKDDGRPIDITEEDLPF